MGKSRKSPSDPTGLLPFGPRPHFKLTFRVPGECGLGQPLPFDATFSPTLRIRSPRMFPARRARASRSRATVRTRRARAAGRSATVRSTPAARSSTKSGAKDGPPPPRSTDGERSSAPRAHSALTAGRVSPVVVSDATALVVLGLTGRQFRGFVRAHSVPHAKCGRRTLARLDLVLEAIDRLSGAKARRSLATAWDEDSIVKMAAGRRPSLERNDLKYAAHKRTK